MKSLAGANPDAKPDYRTQALSDLNKLEQKVVLLNEMLDNVDADKGERFVSGDAYDPESLGAFLSFFHIYIYKYNI
jgi:ADP-ribosylation factor-binding protein GGA